MKSGLGNAGPVFLQISFPEDQVDMLHRAEKLAQLGGYKDFLSFLYQNSTAFLRVHLSRAVMDNEDNVAPDSHCWCRAGLQCGGKPKATSVSFQM